MMQEAKAYFESVGKGEISKSLIHVNFSQKIKLFCKKKEAAVLRQPPLSVSVAYFHSHFIGVPSVPFSKSVHFSLVSMSPYFDISTDMPPIEHLHSFLQDAKPKPIAATANKTNNFFIV